MSGAETLTAHPQPTIEYDRSLEDPRVPYTVSVNGLEVAELLSTFRMPTQDISKLRIVVRRKGPAAGSYNGGGTYFGPISENPPKIVTLYTDWIWEEYQKKLEVAERITRGEEKPKDQFKEFLSTQRLPLYLTQAPPERGLKFADKLLRNAAQRRLNSTLLHEVKHVVDDAEDPLWRRPLHEEALAFGVPQIAFSIGYYELIGPHLVDKPFGIFLAGLIGGMVGTYYLTEFALNKLGITLNEAQREANKFANQLENHSRWRLIVTLRLKDPQ